MSKSLSIAVAQPESRLGDVEYNVGQHAVLVHATAARVVVFPELSLTGYALDATPIDPCDDRVEPLRAACAERGAVALVGAVTVSSSGGRSISMLRIDATEASIVYRKMWLGDRERRWFEPGKRPSVLEVDGWRLGLAICKDTGVAHHALATSSLGIDVYVAGVCEAEADHEVPAQRAAGIIAAHEVPVAFAGFAGPTGGGFDETAGRSTIWQADGSVAVAAGRTAGEVVTTHLNRR